jgi:hypothetical protein
MALEPSERTRDSRLHRAGQRVVTSWARRYTRRVDPRLAERRTSEVEFELWEFAMAKDQYGWSGPRAGAALAWRTVLGMPRDLGWRSDALRTGRPVPAPVRLMSKRRRPRVWIPLVYGHTFDQTNGFIEPERALPHDPSRGSMGAAGNAFGMQGGF